MRITVVSGCQCPDTALSNSDCRREELKDSHLPLTLRIPHSQIPIAGEGFSPST
jgi:hypothetical protein